MVRRTGNTYGLGGDTTNSDEFSLERGFFKVNESILYNVSGKFYVGPQFTVDRRYKLYPSDDIPDDLDDNQAAYDELLSRQWYSYEYGTDGQPYLVLGGGVTALYDSRDNVNSPYKGRYANVNYQYFGGDHQFHLINLEYRDYFQIPNKKKYLSILVSGNFTAGHALYDSLPANGLDPLYLQQEAMLLEGIQGKNIYMGELEYRRNIYKWFGMTAFLDIQFW